MDVTIQESIDVRPMQATDVAAADQIFRHAFATLLGEEPESFMPGRDVIGSRFRTDPVGKLVATLDGRIVGSNVATLWGSFGWFGPLTVHPEYWRRGVAKRLMDATVDLFDAHRCRACGLFTFANAESHHRLYQKYDFWPRFLTKVMSKTVGNAYDSSTRRFSRMTAGERNAAVEGALDLCNELFTGLDLRKEIAGLESQKMGDCIFLQSSDGVEGFAICHYGVGSEADPNGCYVKFAAMRPGSNPDRFRVLIDACEALAREAGLSTLEAGVNLERFGAFQVLQAVGFTTRFTGICMLRQNLPAYNKPGAFVIDDLR